MNGALHRLYTVHCASHALLIEMRRKSTISIYIQLAPSAEPNKRRIFISCDTFYILWKGNTNLKLKLNRDERCQFVGFIEMVPNSKRK